MARAFLMSLVVEQYGRLGEAFVERYDHPWLVWDATTWSAPRADGATRLARVPVEPPPPKERDALCFGLFVKGDIKKIALGRANDNDIVINDGTVSRHHAVLTLGHSGRWQVQPLRSTSATYCGSRQLALNEIAPLVDREKLLVGGVDLTFYEPKSFLEMVRAHSPSAR